jgi:hypothetical protein
MAKRNPSPSSLGPIKARPTLTDRVRDRVAKVEAELERREGTPSPKASKSKKRAPSLGSVAAASKNGEGELEARSLNRVYGELKTTYQQYRRQTGRSAVPELREAVQAFKKGPSLTSLVGVAVFLDDRSLLTW